MKTEHTPGPWKARLYSENDHNHWEIIARSPHLPSLEQTVCELNGPWKKANYQANARLISAAPDLLEACWKALSVLAMDNVPDSTTATRNEAFEAVLKSINKATNNQGDTIKAKGQS